MSKDIIYRQDAIDSLRMDVDIIPFAKAREYTRAAIETIYNRLEELPSAQPEQKKGIHEITELDKISYAVICDKFPNPHVYFNTYDEAEHWARFNQPNYRPYYIVERSEHFEIVGEVR